MRQPVNGRLIILLIILYCATIVHKIPQKAWHNTSINYFRISKFCYVPTGHVALRPRAMQAKHRAKPWGGHHMATLSTKLAMHDDVIKWKHFPRYWPFVRVIHRSPVNSPHEGQWRGVLMFSSIYTWTNRWTNNGDAGDLRRHSAHYNVIVMESGETTSTGNLLTHWGRYNCFMEIVVFWWKFHWKLFSWVQLARSQHWFR